VNLDRIDRQVNFTIEIDALKKIIRKNYLSDCARLENSAEHSWYFAMAAMIMTEHGPSGLDINKVLKMALIHDIVEVDAGDLLVFDEEGKTQPVFSIHPQLHYGRESLERTQRDCIHGT